jgi:hypothetical protein
MGYRFGEPGAYDNLFFKVQDILLGLLFLRLCRNDQPMSSRNQLVGSYTLAGESIVFT